MAPSWVKSDHRASRTARLTTRRKPPPASILRCGRICLPKSSESSGCFHPSHPALLPADHLGPDSVRERGTANRFAFGFLKCVLHEADGFQEQVESLCSSRPLLYTVIVYPAPDSCQGLRIEWWRSEPHPPAADKTAELTRPDSPSQTAPVPSCNQGWLSSPPPAL